MCLRRQSALEVKQRREQVNEDARKHNNQMADVSAHWGMRNRVHRVVIILKEIIRKFRNKFVFSC